MPVSGAIGVGWRSGDLESLPVPSAMEGTVPGQTRLSVRVRRLQVGRDQPGLGPSIVVSCSNLANPGYPGQLWPIWSCPQWSQLVTTGAPNSPASCERSGS